MERMPFRLREDAVQALKVGDIILMRFHRGIIYQAIREATGSYWNHVGLVFEVLKDGDGTRVPLLIEATPHGIEVHRLQRYLDRPEKYDIGFKRMPLLTDDDRGRFLGFFLDVLDTPYDFTRLAAYFLRKYVMRLGGVRAEEYVANRVINVDQFICSSFVQRAYYLAAPPNARDKTLFRADESLGFLYRMEYITPADIAQSKNTDWLHNPHH